MRQSAVSCFAKTSVGTILGTGGNLETLGGRLQLENKLVQLCSCWVLSDAHEEVLERAFLTLLRQSIVDPNQQRYNAIERRESSLAAGAESQSNDFPIQGYLHGQTL